jgi:hypothetical protein
MTTLTNGLLNVSGGDYTFSSLAMIDGTSMIANNGGRLSLPTATSYAHGVGGNSTVTLRSNGSGSMLDLSDLEKIAGATGIGQVAIEAQAGGEIDLSGVIEIVDPEVGSGQGRAIRITADGESSLVNLASLQSFQDRTPVTGIGWGPGYSALIARNEGGMFLGTSLSLTNIELTVGPTGVLLGGNLILRDGSILSGLGNVIASVTNVSGAVIPTDSYVGLTIHGDYSQFEDGVLLAAINGTIDRVNDSR